MEISKIKVLIYLLTFAGYAWSGYGRDIISNLKDAVLAAENVFGDLIGKITDIAVKIKTVHDTLNESIEEDCHWKCSNGAKPVKNKYYTPQSNGCGPLNMEMDGYLPFPEMTKCCNEHDICYGICKNDKDQCDLEFKRCLYRNCDGIEDQGKKTGCKASAKVLYTATTALGCKFYQEAQNQACYCPPSKKKIYPDEL